jgi:ribosomal-protein-alanine N-acetyltransferase
LKTSLSVRRAEKQDLPAVCEVERLSFKDPYPPFFIEMLLKLNPSTFFVAENEKQIVGYLITTKDRCTGHVVSLAVLPQQRRNGIGSALMKTGLETFRRLEVETVRLEVRESNREAQQFYETHGFEYNHRIVGYYGDEDALVYYRKISSSDCANAAYYS